jgi:hypothetical protein
MSQYKYATLAVHAGQHDLILRLLCVPGLPNTLVLANGRKVELVPA